MRRGGASRASWLFASTSAAALVCWSGPAIAECTENPGVSIQAAEGETCFVAGPFTSTDVIAGQATGPGSTLTNAGEGFSSFSFSTSAGSTPAVQADTGGQVILTLTPPFTLGTAMTTGAGSFGLFATGSGEGEGGPIASQINVRNMNVSTTGLDAHAVVANDGASVSLVGGAVTTSGLGSFGIWADGAGSTLIASGVSVTTSGDRDTETGSGSVGVLVTDGATGTFSGGSVTTTGLSADGVVSQDAGSVLTVNGGTTILTKNDGSAGVVVAGGGSMSVTGASITTQGGINPVDGFVPDGAFNGSSPFAAGGGTLSLTNSIIATSGPEAIGVFTGDGGHTTISGGSVTTSGVGASGLSVDGAGSKIIATNVAVTTGGGFDLSTESFSFGVIASNGGGATISGGSVTTNGPVAHGVFAFNGGSIALSDGATVLTTGGGSFGLFVNGAGSSLTATNVSVTTNGGIEPTFGNGAIGAYNGAATPGDPTGGTLKLTNTTILTTGADAHGVNTNSGGQTTVNGGSVATTGPHAIGVLIQGSGTIASLTGTAISTSGVGSNGVVLNGTGSSLTLSGVTVTTTGGRDLETGFDSTGVYNGSNGAGTVVGGGVATIMNSRIMTSGADADGVVTADGGSTTITGGSVGTAGNAAYAVVANTGGLVKLNGTTIATTGDGSGGLGINGAGSEIDATGVTIATKGGYDPISGLHSYGVYNGPFGDLASGGVAKLIDTTILTQGADMFGVNTSTGGVTAISGGSVATTGPGAYAIVVGGGGATTISGTAVRTTGNGGGGLSVEGGSTLSATGVTVATEGGYDTASGRHAYGLFNGPSGTVTSGGVASLSNSTISTLGEGMHGVVTGAGGTTTLAATNVSTAGLGAYGVLAYGGGATNISGGSIATAGANAYGVNADGAGSKVNLASATIVTSGAGATGLFASDRAATGSAGTITATGALGIETKSASAAAVALQGNGATIAATGGGTITAAGAAIAFLGGTGQSATFDNFKIGALVGDLVFADPSVATLNFNATTANAGTGNLLNATAGSAITLNANASMLTGAILTDLASTTNVNLTNGTTWNLTGSSTVTNLSLAHSIVVFAPPGAGGAFKTLTVSNYVGNGANIAMNVALGGSGSAGDRIIINGGKATGSTLLTINNAGGSGGQTSGAGIPIVMATNGGAIAANAFSLANIPIAGGYRYTLDQSGDAWYLVSSPTATVAGLTSSINSVAKAQQSQMITNRVLGSLLLGATQQISCSSCGGGFASIGSFALGGSGRWRLSDNLTLLGGLSYNQWSASGITVYDAPTVAGALVYDFNNWGRSRPFLEVGAGLTPYEQVNYSRVYPNGLTTGYGYASAIDRQASLFGRAGWVDRLTPIDEAAAYVDLGRSWMQTGGYSEQMTAINPFPATVPNGLAALNTTRFGVQYTHLFNGNIEANVGAAVAYGFGAGAGAPFNIFEFGTLAPGAIANSAWFEYGARLGYRVTDRVVVDAFVLGTAGGLAGNFIHGGFGVRLAF